MTSASTCRGLRPWETPRAGALPKGTNTKYFAYTGDDIKSVALKPVVPNTVVITPPLGKLFVYQRIWARGESESVGGVPYGEGWLMPQSNHPHHTFHGKTGANWFKQQAEENALRVIPLETKLTSNNTFIRAWEKPFD